MLVVTKLYMAMNMFRQHCSAASQAAALQPQRPSFNPDLYCYLCGVRTFSL